MWCACGSASALDIKAYHTRLDVAANGSAQASSIVQLTNCEAGRFKLPTGFAGIENFRIQDGPVGVVLKAVGSKEQSTVEIELPENVPGEVKIAFEF